MGYVIAAYGVTAIALLLYGLRLIREQKRLSSR
ncbi:CcmD family protein [Myxococcota bacterium]|nr:CcmD family protein [Myxococcota bacterium]